MSGEYAHVDWRGQPMTARQRQAFIATETYLRRRHPLWRFRFEPTQGSWKSRTDYSGTTHTGAGVVDLVYSGMGFSTNLQKRKYRLVIQALRSVGRQAAFGRGPWVDMPYHFHVCDIDTNGMDVNAEWQVGQYREGFDGLTAGHPDPFPYRPIVIRKWKYVA